MPTRNGKIAKLPNDIREQLNLRLLEGETGRELAAWLNALPAVQSVLGSQFNGSPISEVNLTLWRQGGYLQWLTERECFDSARALADGDCDLAKTGLSAERLLNVLTVRIGQLLMRWDFSPDGSVFDANAFSEVTKKARILQGISRSLLAIHRIQLQSARQKSEPATSSEPSGRAAVSTGSRPRASRGAGGGKERGEPTCSCATPEEHAAPSPATAGCLAVPRPREKEASLATAGLLTEVMNEARQSAEANGDGMLLKTKVLTPGNKSAICNPQSAIPRILSGPITPSSVALKLSRTAIKSDPTLSEILKAV